MDYLGILMRITYAVGDVLLYRNVLRYQFTRIPWRIMVTVLCGIFFIGIPALGFDFPLIKIPGVEFYIDFSRYLPYIMLFVFSKFFFEPIQMGLIFLIFAARLVFSDFFDSILEVTKVCDGWNIKTWSMYAIVFNILFIITILLYSLFTKNVNKQNVSSSIRSSYFFMIGCILLIPYILSYFFLDITEESQIQALSIFYDRLAKIAIVGFAIAMTLLWKKTHQLEEETMLKERCIQEQAIQYQLLDEKQKELCGFRHDLNGHLIAMDRMARLENITGLKAYIQKMVGLQKDTFLIFTGNMIADAILNSYYEQGQKDGVSVEAMGRFESQLEMSETDLCVILTNTISNSYEAASQCQKDRYVLFEVNEYGGFTFLTITNPVSKAPDFIDGVMRTTKEDKSKHGFGIANTIKVLEQYGGEIEWEFEDGNVITKITF